jgi:hypothetical protein
MIELQLFEVNFYKKNQIIISFFIIDAVQVKFGLKDDELATVWPPMLECIKSKRRNTKSKIRKSIPQPGMFIW